MTKVAIVALGASAGGLSALQTFFGHVRTDLDVAFVVVMHLAPDHTSALGEILASETEMPVVTVRKKAMLKPGHIYVIQPGHDLTIADDAVVARPFSTARDRMAPINRLFESVAASRTDGIAVILSGEGSDGADGARAVKVAGGVILAQNPEEAQHSGMPAAVIATGIVDIVASSSALAERLDHCIKPPEHGYGGRRRRGAHLPHPRAASSTHRP